jgi:hypothetical protein
MRLPDDILIYLAAKLSDSEPCEQARPVVSAIFGLQRLSESLGSLQLALALSVKVKSVEMFNAQDVGFALNGLQCFGDSAEGRALVAALVPKVRECNEELNAQQIVSSCRGLQHMSDSAELWQLVAVLTQKVRQSSDQFNAQSVGGVLTGLQRLGNSSEAEQLLNVLAAKIEVCAECLDPKASSYANMLLQKIADSGKEIALNQEYAKEFLFEIKQKIVLLPTEDDAFVAGVYRQLES